MDLDRISVGCKVKVHDYDFEEDMETEMWIPRKKQKLC